ncbi:MAG: 3-hydroxyacyl-CoA dehydrogenase [Giesbergeria sp.]
MEIQISRVGVVGVGTMGQGIAQLAAQAGCEVLLLDIHTGAAQRAIAAIAAQWQRRLESGKIAQNEAVLWQTRVTAVADTSDLASCDLVAEAIGEDLVTKKALFVELETIVAPNALLVSNTSSLSITALAEDLAEPARFCGFHFFNPAPSMKVVEVVPGLRTSLQTCERLDTLAWKMGHTPVRAQDTPGFIVNHAGRGYGTEALRIVSEGVADFATVDRILRDQVGFRLGPFELLDLTGLDVSHPVMESIYHQFYEEPRFRPSVITAQRLAAGMLGRKSGEGFYRYVEGTAQVPAEAPAPVVDEIPPVWVSPRAARRAEIYQLLKNLGASIETGATPSSQAICLVAPLGFDITTMAVVERLDPVRTVGIDMLIDDASTRRRVLATNPATREDMRSAAWALFARDGKPVSVVQDSGGFVTQRVVAHTVNIASDICQQAICSPADLELATTLGLGYPLGPLAMGDRWGPTNILEILFNMQTVYGDPRYRPSPWLRRRGALGLSLTHQRG